MLDVMVIKIVGCILVIIQKKLKVSSLIFDSGFATSSPRWLYNALHKIFSVNFGDLTPRLKQYGRR